MTRLERAAGRLTLLVREDGALAVHSPRGRVGGYDWVIVYPDGSFGRYSDAAVVDGWAPLRVQLAPEIGDAEVAVIAAAVGVPVELVRPEIVRAPFTVEQVESIDGFQRSAAMHSFTCPNHADVRHRVVSGPDDFLHVRPAGLWCVACEYVQGWVHRFMADWSWLNLGRKPDRCPAEQGPNRCEGHTGHGPYLVGDDMYEHGSPLSHVWWGRVL